MKVDTDGSGEMDLAEFEECLASMGIHMSPEQLLLTTREFDENARGTVSIGLGRVVA
jgi:Ca2+-binding EF-hand superfamily protein